MKIRIFCNFILCQLVPCFQSTLHFSNHQSSTFRVNLSKKVDWQTVTNILNTFQFSKMSATAY